MKSITKCTWLMLIPWLFAVAVQAADHAAILPFVTDDVAAVAYLELASVRTSAMLDALRKIGDIPAAEWDEATRVITPVQKWLDELVGNGATRAYLLLRSTDFQDAGSTWVITLRGDSKPDAAARLIQAGPGDTFARVARRGVPKYFQVTNDMLVCATTSAQLARALAPHSTMPRQELLEALKTLGGGDFGLVVIGDRDSRRVSREMLPRLPKPFDSIDGRLLADDLLWIGVAINFPPAFKLLAHAETSRPAVAQTLQQTAVQLLPSRDLPKPSCQGTAVSISLGDDAQQLAQLRDQLSHPLAAALEAAQRKQRVDQFRQLALASVNYESSRGTFVSQATYDAAGRPLLSWRVQLLPYLDQQTLYEQFHLDEPWDSPHNRQLIAHMPATYADPDARVRHSVGAGRTTYVGPIANETVFPPTGSPPNGKPVRMRDITDGTSKTIQFVEVVPERAVVWTQPEDWHVDLDRPLQGVARTDRAGFTSARCDASVHVIPSDISPSALRALLTRAANDLPE